MEKLQVRNLAEIGLITDIEAETLPPNAWTTAHNVRFDDNGVRSGKGWEAALDVASDTILTDKPIDWVYNFVRHDMSRWVLGYLGGMDSWDGETTTRILPRELVSANYYQQWNGDNLNDVLVVTNGLNEPLQWTGTGDMEQLQNWPLGSTCRLIVAFKNHLVAADITEAGIRNPHQVWWSHPADPNTVPISWDYTDPAVDAGRNLIGDSGGRITAMKVLGDALIIYKEDSIWEMRYVGGQNIFQFRQIASIQGAIGLYAVEVLRDRHVFIGDNDVFLFDGANLTSIIENRVRQAFFAELSSTEARRAFLMVDDDNSEVWFALPNTEDHFPGIAYVWNSRTNTWCTRDLPGARHGAAGQYFLMVPGGTEQWGSETVLEWGSETVIPWGGVSSEWLTEGLLVADQHQRLVWMGRGDSADGWDGANPVSAVVLPTLVRDKLILAPDDVVTQAQEIYVRYHGTTLVHVDCKAELDLNNAILLPDDVDYTPGSGPKLSVRATGRVHALRFSYYPEGTGDFVFTGYDVNHTPVGGR